jgi:hypothetical protein
VLAAAATIVLVTAVALMVYRPGAGLRYREWTLKSEDKKDLALLTPSPESAAGSDAATNGEKIGPAFSPSGEKADRFRRTLPEEEASSRERKPSRESAEEDKAPSGSGVLLEESLGTSLGPKDMAGQGPASDQEGQATSPAPKKQAPSKNEEPKMKREKESPPAPLPQEAEEDRVKAPPSEPTVPLPDVFGEGVAGEASQTRDEEAAARDKGGTETEGRREQYLRDQAAALEARGEFQKALALYEQLLERRGYPLGKMKGEAPGSVETGTAEPGRGAGSDGEGEKKEARPHSAPTPEAAPPSAPPKVSCPPEVKAEVEGALRCLRKLFRFRQARDLERWFEQTCK